MSATAIFAQWAATTRHADLPEAVRKEGRRALLNGLACMMGGAAHPARGIFDGVLGPNFGPGEATLLGTSRRADITHAAYANALAGTVDAFCDTHAEAVIHPSAPVIAAALALAEQRHASGEALLLAVILGLETACRLSKAVSVPPARADLGWLQTAIDGGVGAAVAAGSLLGLDAKGMASAIGIAASQAGGLRVGLGSMTVPLVHAQGAEQGLRAALLAAGGFTAPLNIIEAEQGFAEMFSLSPALAHLTVDLGARWEILGLTYKAFPCGIVAHPVIDAALRMRARGLDLSAIERIEARVHPLAVKWTAKPHPRDGNEAQFSLQHWIAVALTRGTASVADVGQDRLADPQLHAMRERVTARADEAMSAISCSFTAVMKDGERVTVDVEHCQGSAGNPMSDADLEAKFRGLAGGVLDETQISTALERCRGVEKIADAALLAQAFSRRLS